MKRVVKLRMLPTDAESAALADTLRTCSEAASWLSNAMHTHRVRRKFDAHKRFYCQIRERFGLSAQPTIRVIGKVSDAYTTLRANIDAGSYGPPGSDRRKAVQQKPIRFRADEGRRLTSAVCRGKSLTPLARARRQCRSGRPMAD